MTEAEKELQKRIAIKVLIQRAENGDAFLLFIKEIFKYHYKKVFRSNWWDKLLSEALMDIYWGKNDRLIIEMPPRHGKTERAMRQFSAYVQGLDSSIKIQYSTYGAGLSSITSAETKEIIESSIYKELFPQLKFSNKINTKTHWLLNGNGGFLGTSVGGAVTGLGAEIAIPDDLLKADDADSKARRDEAHKFFNASILTRLEGRKAIILIMQRLHEDDLVGRVEAKTGLASNGGEWEKISLPVVNDFDSFIDFYHWIENIDITLKNEIENKANKISEEEASIFDVEKMKDKYFLKRQKVNYYKVARELYLKENVLEDTSIKYRGIEAIRPPLTPLDEDEYGLDFICQRYKEMSKTEFKRQYMQDASNSEAGHFNKEDFTYITDVEIPSQNLYILVDNAESTEKSADNRGIVVVGKSVDSSEVVRTIVMNGAFGLWEVYETCSQLISLMSKYPKAPVYIEGAGGGITMEKVLKREILIENAKRQAKGIAQITNAISLYKPSNQISKNEVIKLMTAPLEHHTLQFYKFMNPLFKEQLETEFKKFNPEKKNNKDDCIDPLSKSYFLRECIPKKQLAIKPKTQTRKRKQKPIWRGY